MILVDGLRVMETRCRRRRIDEDVDDELRRTRFGSKKKDKSESLR